MTDENKFDRKKYAEDLREKILQDVHARMGVRARFADRRPGVLPGLILMLIGSVILLDHMGYLESSHLWKFWPAILVVAGAVKFYREANRVSGALLMLGGGVLLLNNLGFTHFSWNDFWPFALIIVGITLIWSRFEVPRIPPASAAGPNLINEFAMFGGVDKRVNMNSFQGGNASALFGGVKLDFRSAEIEGEEAVLNLEALFGGIELIVPERWSVHFEGQNIFGGYSDETRTPAVDAMGTAARKRLILRGRAIFGGIVVKN